MCERASMKVAMPCWMQRRSLEESCGPEPADVHCLKDHVYAPRRSDCIADCAWMSCLYASEG
jgi:hypothetical protein